MKLDNNLSNNASKEYKVYEDLGTVVSVLDDVVYIVGLFNGSMLEQIEFVGKELKGVINYLDNLGMVGVTVLGNSINIKVGDPVKRLVILKRRKGSLCKGMRLRTRTVTKRYLMEYLFFLKLSKERKEEAKLNFDLLKKELERYEKEELSFLGRVQVYCIVVGIVNSLLSAPSGIVKNLPFILYDHLSNELQWLYLIFTAVCIIVGIILTIYLTKKKWDFVKNYELNCNPRIDTKKAAFFFVANNGIRTVLATLSLSGILLGDTCFEKITGKSALTLFGKWLGVYQGPDNVHVIYDKDALESAVIVQEEEIEKFRSEARRQVTSEARKRYTDITRSREEGSSLFQINDFKSKEDD